MGSVIKVGQNSYHVNLFAEAFGGKVHIYGRNHIWGPYGEQSYFISKILENYTVKKRPELSELIAFHERRISFDEFQLRIRSFKDQYSNQQFDGSNFTSAYIAGLIDSDGSISLGYFGTKNPQLRINLSQNCRSLCDQFKFLF